jgi:hypothetical protein
MIRWLALMVTIPSALLLAEDTNSPKRPAEEVVEVQGIKIWKRGTPTNAYTPIANESLERVSWTEARNRIALGVRARKGNAAIITSMNTVPRVDISQTTGINQLDGMNVRYSIIQLKP